MSKVNKGCAEGSLGVGMSTIAVKVGDIAKRKMVSIEVDRPVIEAAKLMAEHDIGSIVVTREGKPIGIITERDVVSRCIAKGKDPNTTQVGAVMSCPLITVDANASLFVATRKMVENNIRRLLVTENGEIVGIFTQKDVLSKIMETFLALASIP